MKKIKKNLDVVLAALLLVVFVAYTLVVKFVGVAPVGPNGSSVGLSSINEKAHLAIGVNFTLYKMTDLLSIIAFAIVGCFALLGLIQWIKRKSFRKVDNEILALGIFYILVGICYLFFEFVIVNRRPVLIDGALEVSYPSSTTLLSITVSLSAILPLRKLIPNKLFKNTATFVLSAFAGFMVFTRILSGVHWITDIIGGVILSLSLLAFYLFVARILNAVNKPKQESIKMEEEKKSSKKPS